MESLVQDVKLGFRSLRRSLIVSLLAVLSLALGVGGNGTVFSLVDAILFRPFPYEAPETIAFVGTVEEGDLGQIAPVSPANFVDWRGRNQVFSQLVAFRGAGVALSGDGEPQRLVAGFVSPGFFEVLGGVSVSRGRTFLPEEERAGADKVAILSHALWEERFGSDPDILGRTITVNAEAHTVVGILDPEFEFLDPTLEIWLPLAVDPSDLPRDERSLIVLGRLAAGVGVEQARADMEKIFTQLQQEYPEDNRRYEARVATFPEAFPGEINERLFALLQGALFFVLLIVCANIANLLLVRGQERRRELAVRASLGAGRLRIVRQLLTESLVLALAGGLLGLVLTFAGVRALNAAFAGQLPPTFEPAVDLRVLAFILAVTVLAGVIFGLIPALQASQLNLADTLKEGSRGVGVGSRRRLLTRTLVVAEVALALVLLCGAGVLVRSFLDLQHSYPGFDTENLLTVQLSLPEAKYPEDPQVLQFYEELLQRMDALPGVAEATAVNSLPRSPGAPTTAFSIDERPPAPGEQRPTTIFLSTPPGYLKTMKIPLLKGRDFTGMDRAESEPVVLINDAMARRFWSAEEPLDQFITLHGESRRIVGVTANVLQELIFTNEEPDPAVYLPMTQFPIRSGYLVLRTASDPQAVAGLLREEIWAVDPDQAVGQIRTMDEFIAQFFVGVRVFNRLLVGFGALALLLAAIGIYGVLAYSVLQRRHEIGIRMAIGARQADVLKMVTRQGMVLAAIGFLLGLPGVLLVVRAVQATLADIAPVTPATVVGISFVVLLIASLASFLPARRAARVDPVVALRQE